MSADKPSRVAVIAVHGVAYHAPGSSADAVSGLLLGLPEQDGRPLYGPITAETVHIPLRPLVIREPLRPGKLGVIQESFQALEERTSFLTREWRTSEAIEKTNTRVADDFMRLTLQDYRGANPKEPKDARDATTYDTTRLRTLRGQAQAGSGTGDGGEGGHQGTGGGGAAGGGGGGAGGGGQVKPVGVDVYEMYWADLSRPQGSVLSFFQALYQLLFHFASLSRLAISTGYLENKDLWQWRALDRMQVYAVRMLTLAIPILNVLLLSTVFGALPRLIPDLRDGDVAPGRAALGAGLLAILLYVSFARFRNAWCKPLAWALQPLLWAIIAACAAYGLAIKDSRHVVLSIEGLILGSAVLYYSVKAYDDVRDGAKETALLLLVAWVAAIFYAWECLKADSVEKATLWAMQIVLAGLRLSWLLLFVFAFAALILGACACWGISGKNKDRLARARAAVRTSRFALAMPTLGILLVTLALWSGLFVKTRGAKDDYGNSTAAQLFGNTIKKPKGGWYGFRLDDLSVGPYLDQRSAAVTIDTRPVESTTRVVVTATIDGRSQNAQLTLNPPSLAVNPATVTGGSPTSATVKLDNKVPPGNVDVEIHTDRAEAPPQAERFSFPQGLAPAPPAAIAATPYETSLQPNEYFQGLLVWSATPGFVLVLGLLLSVFFLLLLWAWPSVYTENEDNVPVRSDNDASRRMGKWTSRGLDSTKIATALAWCAAFALPVAFGVFYGRWKLQSYFLVHWATLILEYMGIGVTSAAVLAGLAGSGTATLGIVLDVDNYLRTSPADATPRARIMERYVSLLRYLSEYRDPADGRGYDRIVIVAHSLGALISADLLRFLKAQAPSPHPEVRLFTMGNPLRQLLNRFFPYLYEWVHAQPENSLSPLPCVTQPQPAPLIGTGALPDPNLLGVKRWVSAYRSGDYVGRSLWLDEWYNRVDPKNPNAVKSYIAAEHPGGSREEMCIGAGAHTHYWDSSAPDIAEKLDELIL